MLPLALRVALVVFVPAWIFGPRPALGDSRLGRLPRRAGARDQLLPRRARPPARASARPRPAGSRPRALRLPGLAGGGRRGGGRRRRRVLGGREPLARRCAGSSVGVGMIAALALTFWFVESRNTAGIRSQRRHRAEAQDRFSEEASRIAEKPVRIRCDESGEYVGAVQHADGVAHVGGDLAYLTPERCLDLYRLAFDGEVTGARRRAGSRCSPTRRGTCAACRTRASTECYALQSGVALGQPARALARTRPGADAPAARRERGRGVADRRVPRPARVQGRRERSTSIPRGSRFP